MSKREEFKQKLRELIEEDEALAKGDDYEVIYVIDDIDVYGGFEEGYRGIDHNILIDESTEWEDILTWGTVVVPETKTYISDEFNERFENLGYSRMPLNRNHIVGM